MCLNGNFLIIFYGDLCHRALGSVVKTITSLFVFLLSAPTSSLWGLQLVVCTLLFLLLSLSLSLSLSLAPILSFAVFPSISICLASCFVVRLCLSFSLPLYVRFCPYSACRCSGMKDYNISVLQLYPGTSFIRHTHTHTQILKCYDGNHD